MPALLAPTYVERCLWQEQATPPPAATRPLPEHADVLVVGAGLCGLSAADTLARAGREVLVLDKEALGWGASSRNGGMVIPELKAGPATLARKYGELGARMHREVAEAFEHVESAITGLDGRGGIDCDYRRSGELLLAHSPRAVDHLRAEVVQHREHGSPASFLTPEELPSEIGSTAFHGGALYGETGSLHPAKYTAGMAARAMVSGATIRDRTAVTELIRRGEQHIISTTRGRVRAQHVIIATNAYTDAAVPWLARRVVPIGSFIIATDVLPADLAESVSPRGRMFVDTLNLLSYWRLTPDRRLAFGGRRSLEPVDVPTARDFLYEKMLRVHPQLAGVAIEYAWGGYVAMTLDRLPHAGRIDGAWYAAGCNGSGLVLNTWLGHCLALTILGQEPPPSFARLKHRPIPMHRLASSYLPLVSRWFTWQDRR